MAMCQTLQALIKKYGKDDVEIAMSQVGCNPDRINCYIKNQLRCES